MATLLDGKLYVKTFSMLYVDCNGHVVFIVKKLSLQYQQMRERDANSEG